MNICNEVCIAGVDPGLAATGLGIIKYRNFKIEEYAFGCIRTSAKLDIGSRLEIIYNRLSDFLERYGPDIMVIEDAFSNDKYPKSAILLGNVIGVVLLAARLKGVSVERISVREAKKSLSGNGSAGKEQLEKSVRSFLKHEGRISPYHASDALALAIAGYNRYSLRYL
jgi:crossover junction endodeoxyribonuclease RuvC